MARKKLWDGLAATDSVEPWDFSLSNLASPRLWPFSPSVPSFSAASGSSSASSAGWRRLGFSANWTGAQKGEGIEFHLLAVAIAAAIMIAGAGAYSIDGMLAGSAAPDRLR